MRVLALVAVSILSAGILAADPASWVDPFIGTDGHGHTYPGATLPFGMVQLSPDTRLEGWDGCSGYHFTDDVVYGFSHTHLSGTGVSDYGDILLMPATEIPRLEERPTSGLATRFDKASEDAEPGYYAVELDGGIGVELTASERAGFHRYRFPTGQPAYVLVDLAHRDATIEAALRIVGDREIEGFRRSAGWARDQIVHFVARFSRPFSGPALHTDGGAVEEITGTQVAAILSFDPTAELRVKVGISAVDVDGARANLDAEIPDWDFDAVRASARERWNQALGRIVVEGGSDEQRTIFNTALYHSLVVPNVYSDVDGRYLGLDRRVHRAEGRRHYTVFSLWDTFRATHPLYTLIERQRTKEFIETFLAHYQQGGRLPVWELAANETDTMIGYHSVSVIADAYLKGIRNFDAELALEAMIDSAGRDHFGLEAYRSQGFVGAEDDAESVSKTLEYAYDDFCIAQMAGALGKSQIEAEFQRRSQSWRHLLDPATGFMRPRRNQRWLVPFDPRRVDNHYTEANAWQYSLYVPHDLRGLADALGGDAAFVERLDALFEADPETLGRDQLDITGLIGQYAHGNEPSHHMAWLYHYAGRPDRSAERVREILSTLYTPAPDGLAGNEDCGQMSSWYVFAALGLYPVCPCSPDYVLVPPIFASATLSFEDGRHFTLRTSGAGPYVRSATLNGEPLTRSYLRHDEIIAGGELVLNLSSEPEPGWGTAPADRPLTSAAGERVLAAPYAVADSDVFRDRLTVELAAPDPGVRLQVSVDGGPSAVYEAPLALDRSATLRFWAERGRLRSPEVEASFRRLERDWRITLAHSPSPMYDAGGPLALIDGLRGDGSWRTGGWHGYRYTDFEATVDLGRRQPIQRAGASFLQDVRSWIWMPSSVVIEVSDDGKTFRPVTRIAAGVADDEEGLIRRDLIADFDASVADFDAVEGRYVRILARNYGIIPDWHPGRGDGAWIFVDEILIE